MADYRLTDRAFSRLWRRSKTYSDREIRWLARRRGLEFIQHKTAIQVRVPKSKKVVANFQEISVPEIKPDANERSRTLGALRNG